MLAVLIATFVLMAAAYWWQLESVVQNPDLGPQSHAMETDSQADNRPRQPNGVSADSARSIATYTHQSSAQTKLTNANPRSAILGETTIELPAAEAQSWLNDAFSPQWSQQWSTLCAERRNRTEPCRPLAEMAVRFGRPNAPNEDPWATFMTQELTMLAEQVRSSAAAPWFRVNCNADGCIFAAAGAKQDKLPMGADVQSVIRRQSWARDFDDIIFAGCISCPRVNTYIVVMPRRQLELGDS